MIETEKILRDLCSCGGVSGSENGASDVFLKYAKPYCSSFYKDTLGNLIIKKGSGKKKIMVEAHCDKIGLMISGITDQGFLLFTEIGGHDKKIMPSTTVTVHGKKEDIFGVIGSVPPHLKKKQSFDISDLCIDVGLTHDEALKAVSVGDIAEFNTEYEKLCGDYAAASALDDRAGLAVLLEVMKTECPKNCEIIFVASTQEEVGLRGAKTAAFAENPDVYICVDVCHGKTPDASKNVYQTGKGAVITVGPNVQPYVSRALIQTAREKGISYQIDVDGGCTGTNAWTVQIARRGIPTGLLSISLRYMHTRYEVISLKDIDITAKLICEYIKKESENGDK